jgi:hypothetical protein
MTEKLLPCLHCAGADIRFDKHVSESSPTGEIWSMCCYDCGATFPNRYRKELLVEAWNTRALQVVDHAPETLMHKFAMDLAERTSAEMAADEITKLRAEREAAARDMQERCAGWHDAQATICRDLAKANQGNEVGIVFHALVVDHEVAANVIRALPDAPIVRNLI